MDAILIMAIILAGVFSLIFISCLVVIARRRNISICHKRECVCVEPNESFFKSENEYNLVASKRAINYSINGSTRLYLNKIKNSADVAKYRKEVERLEL